MSFQANRRQSQPDDGGYALPIVIVVIAVGAMVAIAMLGYAAALLRAGEDDADSLLHLYAADAGITAKKKDLERGIGTPLPPFGDIEVMVGVTPVILPSALLPTPTPRAIWLGLPSPLENVSTPVTIESVPPGSALDIRWRYTHIPTPTPTSTPLPTSVPSPPSNAQTSTLTPTSPVSPRRRTSDVQTPTPTPIPTPVRPTINLKVNGTLIPSSESCEYSDEQVLTCSVEFEPADPPEAKDVTISFNSGGETVSSSPFATSCPNEYEHLSHFCITAEPMDYVVVSTTRCATVTAYIRRFPRWEPSGELRDDTPYDVTILSWKPYEPYEEGGPDPQCE